MIRVAKVYAMTVLGCVMLGHLFVAKPLELFGHVEANRLWPIYVVTVLVGLYLAYRTPMPRYCRCPTCGSDVEESRIEVST